MMVAADWRGLGVGTALVAAAIEWARSRGLHKLALSGFPHDGCGDLRLNEGLLFAARETGSHGDSRLRM